MATALLGVLIVAGSRNLHHFDAALVGYTFATLFATFGITYRYTMWLSRPPTRMYWRRGWQTFATPRFALTNIAELARRAVVEFAGNRFIFRRGRLRGLAHWCIMWGCLIAAAITFPLVWASFLVIAGVMLALRRRMIDHGAAAVQQFGEDILPLILLLAISVTGLLLTVSYTWMRGYAYSFLAILHAATVIFTLLWLPFGKFFHLFQRPAQLGVSFYKDAGARSEQAKCARCGAAYASAAMIRDLITVERDLGFRYELANGGADHYQRICPRCRRALLGLAQGAMWMEPR